MYSITKNNIDNRGVNMSDFSKKIISDFMINRIYTRLTETLQRKPKATKKEILQLLFCKLNQDYEPMKSSKLYNKHSVEYCRLLEIIN